MSIGKDFKEFALKGNVVDLAVAVVIGAAFGKIVTAVVDDLVMPVVGAVLPGGEWRTFTVSALNLKVGHMLGAMVDFVIVAAVLFVVVVKLLGKLHQTKAPAVPAPAPTKICPECLEAIPAAARRCRACTASLAA